MSDPGRREVSTMVILVHPEDVNVADAKALAAKHDATIVSNRFVKRGQFLVTTSAVLDLAEQWTNPRRTP